MLRIFKNKFADKSYLPAFQLHEYCLNTIYRHCKQILFNLLSLALPSTLSNYIKGLQFTFNLAT